MAQPGSADDLSLLAALRAGDNNAFRTVFNKYSRQLCVHAYELINDTEIARDIVSEAFIILYENRLKYESLLHVKNSLYLITRNLGLKHLRDKRKIEEKHLLASGDEVENSILTQIIHNEFIEELYQLLNELPEAQRRIIEIWVNENKSLLQIADELEMTLENVKVSKHRALLFLRAAAIFRKLKSRLPIML